MIKTQTLTRTPHICSNRMVSFPSRTNIHVMTRYPTDETNFWSQAIPNKVTRFPTVVAGHFTIPWIDERGLTLVLGSMVITLRRCPPRRRLLLALPRGLLLALKRLLPRWWRSKSGLPLLLLLLNPPLISPSLHLGLWKPLLRPRRTRGRRARTLQMRGLLPHPSSTFRH